MIQQDRTSLILAHTPLVLTWAKRYQTTAKRLGIGLDDLISAGWLGFCRGLQNWDSSRGVTPGAFLGRWVFGEIHRACHPKRKQAPELASIEAIGMAIPDRRIPESAELEFREWVESLPLASKIAAKALSEGQKPLAVQRRLGLSERQFKGLLNGLAARLHSGY